MNYLQPYTQLCITKDICGEFKRTINQSYKLSNFEDYNF